MGATEAMSEFQRSQLAARAAKNTLERVVDLQAGSGQPWDLVDRFVSEENQDGVVDLEGIDWLKSGREEAWRQEGWLIDARRGRTGDDWIKWP